MISENIAQATQVLVVDLPSIQPLQLALLVLETLEKWLPSFQEKYVQANLSEKENDISGLLNRFLQDELGHHSSIDFNREEGVDFCIYMKPLDMGAEPYFVIEAKRLPTTHRTTEYVYIEKTMDGGIERFKREQKGFNQPLSISAMVGYVQSHDFSYWLEKINSWIDDLIKQPADIRWTEQDKLQESPSINLLGRYISTHSRKTLQDIKLYHFWLNMY